jgi:hypothetical protein
MSVIGPTSNGAADICVRVHVPPERSNRYT